MWSHHVWWIRYVTHAKSSRLMYTRDMNHSHMRLDAFTQYITSVTSVWMSRSVCNRHWHVAHVKESCPNVDESWDMCVRVISHMRMSRSVCNRHWHVAHVNESCLNVDESCLNVISCVNESICLQQMLACRACEWVMSQCGWVMSQCDLMRECIMSHVWPHHETQHHPQWDMTHSYVRHDSFACATWLVHLCNVT